ncbi:hypothetical protein GCM10012275_16200 [Longimycelium tulufanense]|uniref:Carrier domain-containing protein n=1 Tax=Longimycelium tulufanense TaxID=907463 RepID=A0A8J3C9J5_9PSEU|nr:non-ribosomal peptide synthetase [Longimycelium tulufanense]GGM45946.1 hypothetical protein GCM10012275_16200 [Longimycelium tulufanense]
MPVAIEDVYPLSPMQEGMLFHTLAEPGSGVYVEQMSVALRGALDPVALRAAWQGVVDRHPALRTAFAWQRSDQPLQVVQERVEIPFVELDWSDLAPQQQAEGVHDLLAAERASGFDLHLAPAMRLHLIRLAADTHRLVWTYHHIIVDGWSLPLILAEVARRYAAHHDGTPLDLGPAHPYRDYIAWLRMVDPTDDEAFWRGELAGYEPATLDILRRSEPHGHGAQETEEAEDACELVLDATETASLRAALRTRRITLGTAAQAAWAVLLSRYTGRRDVALGSVTAARPFELNAVDEIVGLFMNALPLRLVVDPAMTGGDWFDHVQDVISGVQGHEHVSPLAVQRWSGLPHGSQLFETTVAVENLAPDSAMWSRFADLSLSDMKVHGRTSFPVSVKVIPAEMLRLRLDYDPARLAVPAAHRMLGHLRQLLVGLTFNPARPIGQVPMLTSAERKQIATWNSRRTLTPTARTCYRAIEEVAARQPDAVALVNHERTRTYAEMDAEANRLANLLRQHGVDRDQIVGLALERSIELIVGMLASHKAGGAFCVLDPRYPAARLALVVEDAAPTVIVTTKAHAPALSASPDNDIPVIVLDDPASGLAGQPSSPPGVEAGPDWLAYLVYTSGSTGRPKGVQVEHAGLRNVVAGNEKLWGYTPEDRVLQFFANTFDACLLEIFCTLVCGAQLVLIDRDRLLPGQHLVDAIEEHGITAAKFTPSALAALPADATLPGLHTITVGGEKCTADLVRRFAPGRRFVNQYGPTEASIVTTARLCEPDDTDPTIGHPLPNCTVHVLDPDGQELPVGVVGELCLGGIGVARGYANRPELTAERFVPDPANPGQRLYRTGDLVRRTEDGDCEILGRIDHQIKVRGFRIEPGEIEAVLREHPAVFQALVTGHGESSERQLVAYLVLHDDALAEAGDERVVDELRATLAATLPEHMVPNTFVVLPSFPLNPHGKIDRKALPAPGAARTEHAPALVRPRDSVELLVARIWAEVLGLATVGVTENFFHIGGHSLLAMRVTSRLSREFGRDLDLRALFERPTVEQMADLLRSGGGDRPRTPVVALRGTGSQAPLFCVHPAVGNVIAYQPLVGALGEDIPFYGLEEIAPEPGEQLTVEKVAARYLELVREIQPTGPYHVGGWSFGGVVAYEMARQLTAAGESVAIVALFDTALPLREMPRITDQERTAHWLMRVVHYLSATFGHPIQLAVDQVAGLPEAEQLDALAEACTKAGLIASDTNRTMLRALYSNYTRSSALARHYTPQPYDGPVVLYQGEEPMPDEASDPEHNRTHPTFGWSEVCPNLEVVPVPGNHMTLMNQPNVEIVVRHLRPRLVAGRADSDWSDAVSPRTPNTPHHLSTSR